MVFCTLSKSAFGNVSLNDRVLDFVAQRLTTLIQKNLMAVLSNSLKED
jgi:hypothetical protein